VKAFVKAVAVQSQLGSAKQAPAPTFRVSLLAPGLGQACARRLVAPASNTFVVKINYWLSM
jgi:hypothetical protein